MELPRKALNTRNVLIDRENESNNKVEQSGELNAKALKPAEDQQRDSGLGVKDRHTTQRTKSWPMNENESGQASTHGRAQRKSLRAREADERLCNE